jgi:hypothetical protein
LLTVFLVGQLLDPSDVAIGVGKRQVNQSAFARIVGQDLQD